MQELGLPEVAIETADADDPIAGQGEEMSLRQLLRVFQFGRAEAFERYLFGGPRVAGKATLLADVAKNTVGGVLGNAVTAELSNLGVFEMLGLGSGPDPVLNAKLDQIINQLMVIQADITDLKSDVATLTNTVIAEADLVQLQTLLHDMEDASNSIQMRRHADHRRRSR